MSDRVLVLAGDFYHPASVLMDGLVGFNIDGTKFELGSMDRLSDFDALIIAKANAVSADDPSPWTCADTDEAIDRFVREGGAIVFIHAGTVGYTGVLREMAGGAFRHHPEACMVRIEPAPRNDNVSFQFEPFEVFDEHYLMEFDGGAEVLADSVSDSGREPAAWVRSWGKGRVGVLTPGHYAGVWEHREFKNLTGSLLSVLLS